MIDPYDLPDDMKQNMNDGGATHGLNDIEVDDMDLPRRGNPRWVGGAPVSQSAGASKEREDIEELKKELTKISGELERLKCACENIVKLVQIVAKHVGFNI